MGIFALVIACAAVLALLVMLLQKKKTGIKTGTAFIFGAFALPLCVLIGRGAYWLCSIEWMKKINVSFWDFAGSGYSYMLYGAVLGGFAAVFLTAKITGESFGKVADAMEKYSFKGREVEVVGQIRTGSYTGKDGKKVYTTDIWCKQVVFKSWKKETEPRRPEPARPMDDDTIPFY